MDVAEEGGRLRRGRKKRTKNRRRREGAMIISGILNEK